MTGSTIRDIEDRKHRAQRGQILRFLAIAFPRWVTPLMVRRHLRDNRLPLTFESLGFQFEYLQEKGWVEIEKKENRETDQTEIVAVKLTAAGVDLVDQRPAGDTGLDF